MLALKQNVSIVIDELTNRFIVLNGFNSKHNFSSDFISGNFPKRLHQLSATLKVATTTGSHRFMGTFYDFLLWLTS